MLDLGKKSVLLNFCFGDGRTNSTWFLDMEVIGFEPPRPSSDKPLLIIPTKSFRVFLCVPTI